MVRERANRSAADKATLVAMNAELEGLFSAFSSKLLADEKRYTFVTAERSEEHTSELQSLMRLSYAVFCLKKKNLPLAKLTTSIAALIQSYVARLDHHPQSERANL